MKVIITTNARLFRTPEGEYYTKIVYGYQFFKRYLNVFEEIRLVAHVKDVDSSFVIGMLRVDGPHLEVYHVPFPEGKIQYILQYRRIGRALKGCCDGCSAAILRIPDQLAFQVMKRVIKYKMPFGVEVTSNSWEFFDEGYRSIFKWFLRYYWDYMQAKACREANATSYVTKYGIQRRYPPTLGAGFYTTNITSADMSGYKMAAPRDYGLLPLRKFSIIHVAGTINFLAKGHGELIKALSILKKRGYEIQCRLVGNGELIPEYQTIVDQEHLDVVYLGTLTPVQVQEALKNADMFVFPSYREGLPRVVIEAMMCGLPCVATDLPGIQELLDLEMLVHVKDIVPLADKIDFMATHPELMTQQSRRNIEVSKEYRADVITNKRIEFYSFIKRLAIK